VLFPIFMGLLVEVLATAPSADRPALTLEEALRRAADAHPALRAAGHRTEAAHHRRRDAARWPNPSLSAEIEDFGGELGSDRSETTLEIGQSLELGGDRDARTGTAEARVDASTAEAEALRLEILAGTGERFLEAWLLEQRVARLTAAVESAVAAESAAAARTRAGAAPAFERLRIANFRSLREVERQTAAFELASARRRLALEWGADALDAPALTLDEPAARAIPDTSQLMSMVAAHPRIQLAAAEVAVASWQAREARAARVPDLALTAGVRHLAEVPGTGFVAGLTMPIPLWSSGAGAADAADRERYAAEARAEDQGRRLREAAGASRDLCVATFEAYRRLRDEARPAAEEAMRQIVAAFRAGRLGYLDLHEGQKSLIETDFLLMEATAAAWRARLGLELLIGTWSGRPGGRDE
jgi:cobalt-zinc-cadmium efflux system outer membrane protein